ncbi:DUF3015 family protein [Marinobacter sp. LQ44]|uniref:DUF3015 family protein n=1 Tax=unclassified Marinobacter TaxID=83889 RepID=UPI000718F747|nr:DUF3015 family protein [Marinobacter sp. LQ44]AMQ88581.1 hypothetical protein ASQ50_07655 [Marinobacter sp. LQ44]
MKRIVLGALLISASSMVFAQPGCGVGAMIWKGQSGVIPHVLGATTNGMASQTVSMTFGIVGCNTNQSVQSMAMLIDSRGSAVAADISKGSGENLEAMAVTLGITPDERPAFYHLLQSNFEIIFPSPEATTGQAVDAIVSLMEQDKSLRKYVVA